MARACAQVSQLVTVMGMGEMDVGGAGAATWQALEQLSSLVVAATCQG